MERFRRQRFLPRLMFISARSLFNRVRQRPDIKALCEFFTQGSFVYPAFVFRLLLVLRRPSRGFKRLKNSFFPNASFFASFQRRFPLWFEQKASVSAAFGSFRQFKLVPDAPDGLKAPLVRHALQLLAQALDVHIHGSRVAEVVKTPNLVQKLIAGEDAVG